MAWTIDATVTVPPPMNGPVLSRLSAQAPADYMAAIQSQARSVRLEVRCSPDGGGRREER
jgi:hypothetical protein